MTTVATDGYVVAFDTRATRGATVSTDSLNKAVMLDDGQIVASAGTLDDMLAFHEYMRRLPNDAKPKLDSSFIGIRVNPSTGRVWAYEGNLIPFEVTTPHCIGMGDDLARGAMAMGADPFKAVQIAMQLGPHHTGGEVRFLGDRAGVDYIARYPNESQAAYEERVRAIVFNRGFADGAVPGGRPMSTGGASAPMRQGGVERIGSQWQHWRRDDEPWKLIRPHTRTPKRSNNIYVHRRSSDSLEGAVRHRRATDQTG